MDAETKGQPQETEQHARDMANAIRALAIDAVQKANSGHPGMPMGMADVASVLFRDFLRIDPQNPSWPDRDRFVLSNGHGSMLLYALHYLLGYEDMTLDQLKNFRQIGSKTAGHPEYGHALGIETTTGPLGQGLANAVGFALAERMMNARYGDDLVDHKTYCIVGDGCLMEGISHEAIDLAGHLKLNRLIVLFDDNGISIDGKTSLATSMDQVARFKAAGWNAEHVDGHKPDEVKAALERAHSSDKPTMIACKTIIGYGSPKLAGSEKSHGAPLGDEEIKATRAKLVWESEPFVIPDELLSTWRAVGAKGKGRREEWEKRHAASAKKAEFDAAVSGKLPDDMAAQWTAYREKLVAEKPKLATRKSSEAALGFVNDLTALTLGGSADLTHSVFTQTKNQSSVSADNYAGRYIHYGIREHAMAAVMNGLALHGGFIPYGGTFLTFADYMRGGMRLSALMGIRVVYVLTHDSIGLGEDGPTHQPIEHLAMLRATPNILVLRPADAVETAEAWEIALDETKRPSVLSLSRQNLPTLRDDAGENRTRRGAYVLRDTDGARDVTIMATGSEVEIAVTAAEKLGSEGVKAAVVSFPCFELFAEQDEAYRASVLGSAPRVAIEAAIGFGWERWTGDNGIFIGMTGFGASGPAPKLYEEFGITADHAVQAAKTLLGR